MWLTFGWHVADMWLTCDWHMAYIKHNFEKWPELVSEFKWVKKWLLERLSPLKTPSIMATSFCWHVTDMWLKCGWHVADMWLTCGRNCIVQGGRGITEIFLGLESYFFCYLVAHAKFHYPRTTPSGRKVTGLEERREEKNTVNSGHYVLPSTPKGSARITSHTCLQKKR
jgi:hypothetical protein